MVKRKIIWSHRAQIKLFEILEFYAKRNKSRTYSIKLYKRFTKSLNLLHKHPELGKKSEIEDVRGIIVGDYILFYEQTPKNIIVHTVWDCRQNPAKLTIK
ncbi:MAG: type II toxin-antitoxin system RelE/ParE family toxin [Bacteroidia bacterium]|nr:type II toxin-antitoxin system RelE/ParE family toxin [Bacteroidia bacterium]